MPTRRRLLATLAAGAVGSAGCTVEDDDIQHLEPERERWSFQANRRITTTPAVDGDSVYVGSNDSNFYALDAGTGRERWRFETDGEVRSSPLLFRDSLYFGSLDGRLYSVSLDGRREGRFQTGSEIWAAPTVSGDCIVVGTSDGTLWSVDSGDLEPCWELKLGGRLPAGARRSGDSLFVGSDPDGLHAVSTDGALRWTYPTKDAVIQKPAVHDDVVLFSLTLGDADPTFHAISRRTGDRRWARQIGHGSVSNPSVYEGTVYFGSFGLDLHALDVETGERLWQYDARGNVNSSPTIAGDVLYVGDSSGIVHALDPETADVLWRFETGNAVNASPVIVDDVAYVASNDGHVYALDVT